MEWAVCGRRLFSYTRGLSKISTFQVNNFVPDLSDHCPTTTILKTNAPKMLNDYENYEFIGNQKKSGTKKLNKSLKIYCKQQTPNYV